MNKFRVLFLYPNIQSDTLVPPSLALFSSILKEKDVEVDLFDTTNYQMTDTAMDSNSNLVKVKNLNVRPFEIRRVTKTSDPYKDLSEKIRSFDPDLIAVSATENAFLLAMDFLQKTEHQNIPVILGGVFATFAPELAMKWQEIDILCVGEGEYVFPELCKRMREGKDISDIPNLWIRQKDGSIKKNSLGLLADIDENPLPDYSIFEESRFYRPMAGRIYRMFPVETHRGCPFSCHFCNSPAQRKLYYSNNQRFFRRKSTRKVHEDLIFLKEKMRAEYIFFWADTLFAYSEKEFNEFCETYQEIRVPFWCQARPEEITENRIEKLKAIGVDRMGFGIEHGNENFRRKIVGRAYKNRDIVKKLEILTAHNIPFSVNNIIGFPDETRELVFDTIELNRQMASDTLSCSIFVPFHGTWLRRVCEQKEYVNPETICPTNSDDSVLRMPPPYLSGNEMRSLRRVFSMYVKFPKSYWPEIQKAERLTSEGDKIWMELRKEFIETFF